MILQSLDWLRIEFMQKALLGSMVLSISCGMVGMFVILRRIVFISMALAEVSSAAVALAMVLAFDPSITAVVATLLATFLLAMASYRPSRFPAEVLIALVYIAASSAAILLIAKNPQGEVELMNVLFGNILTVNKRQLMEAIGVALPTLVAMAVFFRLFLFTAFDPEMASACGISSSFWQSLFYLMLGGIIVVGIRMSGALLTFAYLVIPPYVGLRLSRSMRGAVAWGLVLGPVATFLGLWASFAYDLPTGPSITGVLVIYGFLSLLVKRGR